MTEKLSYNEYEKMMVKIAYWLIKNNKKVSEKDYYNINNHGVKKTYIKTKILEGKFQSHYRSDFNRAKNILF